MQAGELAFSDVQAFTSRVLVNGIQRPVMSWSVDRDLVGDLPEQVVAGGGVAQAGGSITWGSDLDVDTGAVNPWNPSTGWIPKEGDAVQILAGDGLTEWSQFVGVIDSSSGDIGGGFSSKIIDRIDDFSRKVRLPALVDVMPPVDVSLEFRRFRLSPRFYVMTAMRRAGFHVTPAPEAACALDVPAVGSMWPLIGDMLTCRRGSNPEESPMWPGGLFVRDVTSSYAPNVARSGALPVQLTMQRGPEHTGVARIRVLYGASVVVLSVTATQAQAWVNGVNVVSIPVTSACIISYLFKNGSVQIRSSQGQAASGSAAWSVTTLMSIIEVIGDEASHFNGVQVSNPQPWHEFASLGFTPSARITTGVMHDTLEACPATGDQSARDLLHEISQALLWPFWIDETGMAKAIQSDALRGQAPVQTVTTLDDIRSLSWRRDLLGARSEIITSYDEWTISRSNDYSVELWRSTEAVVLLTGQRHESLVEPPAGEVWLMVDETLTVPGVSPLTDANKGVGSVAGGVYTNGVSEEWAPLPSAVKLSVGLTKVTEGIWRFAAAAVGTIPAGWQVELRTWSSTFAGRTSLWPYWWDNQLPIIRGKGKAVPTKKTRNPTIAGTIGPVLELDCKHWATGHLASNRTRVVDEVTNFVSGQVVNPQPVITGMRVGFDPRRQLGDVITVSSPDFMGVELRALITGLSTNAGGSYSQELSVRIISVETTFTTYAGFAEAWGPTADYDTFAAAWDTVSTYTDLNNDPLRGNN